MIGLRINMVKRLRIMILLDLLVEGPVESYLCKAIVALHTSRFV
jgi:hypothetical protein